MNTVRMIPELQAVWQEVMNLRREFGLQGNLPLAQRMDVLRKKIEFAANRLNAASPPRDTPTVTAPPPQAAVEPEVSRRRTPKKLVV